jgi:uncharacterized membrane protein
METTNNSRNYFWLLNLVLAIPFVYLAFVWNTLPEKVPIHFDIHGEPDDYGTPRTLLLILLFVAVITFGVTLLLTNIKRIDPKHSANSATLMRKISLFLNFFFSAVMIFIVYISSTGKTITPGFLLAGLGLLFAFLGNLMNNVKPNYFVGIRTPWTLENEVVWRKTHHLSSRLWFFGGLCAAVLVLILPDTAATAVFITTICVLVTVPLVYSYLVYKDLKK